MAFVAFMLFCVFTFVFLILCLSVFVAKCILEIYEHFCFLCFHSCWCFQFSGSFGFLSSVPTEKSQEIFLVSQKIFWERKLLCTHLEFRQSLIAGTKWAIPSAQYCSILLTQVANQNTEFTAHLARSQHLRCLHISCNV